MNCYCLNSKEGRKEGKVQGKGGGRERGKEGKRKETDQLALQSLSPKAGLCIILSNSFSWIFSPFALETYTQIALQVYGHFPRCSILTPGSVLCRLNSVCLECALHSSTLSLPTHQRGSCSDQLQCSDCSFTSKACAAQRGTRASQAGRCARVQSRKCWVDRMKPKQAGL